MPNLLIELFSEEIPARMQDRARQELAGRMFTALKKERLSIGAGKAFSTPRRLTLFIENIGSESLPSKEEMKGPRVDAPEKAIEGFCRGKGLKFSDLQERATPKGRFYFAEVETKGRPAAEIVAESLEQVIRSFPWPKAMRWGAGSLRWVRPLHRILCILTTEDGAQVVPLTLDGITAADVTEGHRFMAPAPFAVTGFEDYEAKLKRARVVLSPSERAEAIWNDATQAAFALGLEVVEDAGLLAEVAGLVEWPVVLMGEIGAEFLDLPPEVLQTSMKEHQKFFSVRNPKTDRIERFVTVANIETADDGAVILAGNQKVLAARLSDAKFFWDNDLRTVRAQGMEHWTAGLHSVTFHNKLGSQKARVDRIAALARELAPVTGANPDLAEQAARVAKADLQSEMVGEFPELQGLMGRYYAEAAGLPAEVAAACQEHYAPLGPSDAVPTAPVSVAVALADKLDTLTGFWAIDEKPTGSKDPYALRRAALGVIRLVLGNCLELDLEQMLLSCWSLHKSALNERYNCFMLQEKVLGDANKNEPKTKLINRQISPQFPDKLGGYEFSVLCVHTNEAEDFIKTQSYKIEFIKDGERVTKGTVLYLPSAFIPDLLAFFHDRLKVHLKGEGIRHDVLDACMAMPGNDDLTLLVNRARALQAVIDTEDGINLVQGFKRANNILSQAEEKDGVEYSFGADAKFAEDDTEKALFAALDTAEARIAPAMAQEDFTTAMAAMAALRPQVDAFFEAVQVNSENPVLRRNRLNLLSRIRTLCLSVADLTRLDG